MVYFSWIMEVFWIDFNVIFRIVFIFGRGYFRLSKYFFCVEWSLFFCGLVRKR